MLVVCAADAGLSMSQGVHCYSGPHDGDNGGLLANVVGT